MGYICRGRDRPMDEDTDIDDITARASESVSYC
jgi:hypothetical protein